LRFSLGFGPKIIGTTRGGTEYRLSLIPLGGYVKMLGEDSEEELSEDQLAGSFSKQPVSKRLAIVFAGPFSNFLLARSHFHIPFRFFRIHERLPEIGSVNRDHLPNRRGSRLEDRVLSINGQQIDTWEDLSGSMKSSARTR